MLALTGLDPADRLLLIPYRSNKLDQLPQRLKNLLGGRPMLELDPTYVQDLRQRVQHHQQGGTQPYSTDAAQVIASVLPYTAGNVQYQRIEAKIQRLQQQGLSGAGLEAALLAEIRREAIADPTLENLLAPTAKRVGLVAGVSSLSTDFALRNEAYKGESGYTTTSRISFNARDVESVQATQAHLRDVFQSGRTVVTRDGLFVLRPQGHMEHIAQFDQQGVLNLIDTKVATSEGAALGQQGIKLATFGLQERDGLSVVMDVGGFEQSRGRYTLEVSLLHTARETGGMRPGYGSVKGPYQFLQRGLFDRVSQTLAAQTGQGSSDTLYGIYTPSLLKGFSYDSGLALIADTTDRQQLTSMDARQMAAGMLLSLFDQDRAAVGAAADYLASQGRTRQAAALRLSLPSLQPASANSRTRGAMGSSMPLLAVMGRAADPNASPEVSMTALRDRLLQVLAGDAAMGTQIQNDLSRLFDQALGTRAGGIGPMRDSSITVRAAATAAFGLDLARQYMSAGFTGTTGMQASASLIDATRYQQSGSAGMAHRRMVHSLATTAGVRLGTEQDYLSLTPDELGTELEERLGLLQRAIQRVPIFQMRMPTVASQSLVPHGSQTQVNLELQYLTGMSTLLFGTMQGRSEQQAWQGVTELQSAYSMLTGLGRYSLGHGRADIQLVMGGGNNYSHLQELAGVTRQGEQRFRQQVADERYQRALDTGLSEAEALLVRDSTLQATLNRINEGTFEGERAIFDPASSLLDVMKTLAPNQAGACTTILVLPQLVSYADTERGTLRVGVAPQYDGMLGALPAFDTGILLGADVLNQAALRFPTFDSQALTNQLRLRQVMLEMDTVGLLGMLTSYDPSHTPGGMLELDSEQAQLFHEFSRLMSQSVSDTSELLATMLQKRAAGSSLEVRGRSFVPTSSWFLGSGEYIAGSAMEADSPLGLPKLIGALSNQLYQQSRQAYPDTLVPPAPLADWAGATPDERDAYLQARDAYRVQRAILGGPVVFQQQAVVDRLANIVHTLRPQARPGMGTQFEQRIRDSISVEIPGRVRRMGGDMLAQFQSAADGSSWAQNYLMQAQLDVDARAQAIYDFASLWPQRPGPQDYAALQQFSEEVDYDTLRIINSLDRSSDLDLGAIRDTIVDSTHRYLYGQADRVVYSRGQGDKRRGHARGDHYRRYRQLGLTGQAVIPDRDPNALRQ
jgi:hypothetical protein